MLDKDYQSELQTKLAGRSILDMTTVEIERAYQTIAEINSNVAELRVAWLGNHTLDYIVRSASVAALTHGLQISSYVGAFGQYFQEILDGRSQLYTFHPDIVVLWVSLRSGFRDLVEGGAGLSQTDRLKLMDKALKHICEWIELAKQRSRASLFICNFSRPLAPRLGLADMSSAAGEAKLFAELNLRLLELYCNDPRVFLLDIDNAIAAVGRSSSWNPTLYRMAKIEWGGKAANAAADLFARSFRAFCRPAKKCLIVDLDNTLWGGVVGEDGPDGIRIDEGDPIGECFQAFQRSLIDLKARGVLLAICSKNNPADVEEVFARRRDMPLQFEDFAAKRINWNHKHENICSIADELNIGLESLVFVDDNPAECALVVQTLPEVKTIQLPQDPAGYADLILGMVDFDKLALTEEDQHKTEQYHANAARNAHRTNVKDLNSYLESLGTTIKFGVPSPENLTRVHQLFSKTNQFNTTTKRYSLNQIQDFLMQESCLLETIRAKDNFGDLGIIGLYLLRQEGEVAEIDSFIVSCRALGRSIETAICNRIKEKAFSRPEISVLVGSYIPTRKNMPCATFYDDEGFRVTSEREDGSRTYELKRCDFRIRSCPGINNIDQGAGKDKDK